MKLWILEPIELWNPWYDRAFGFVVQAETETDARAIAADHCGDEGRAAWGSSDETTCIELEAGESPGVVMRDFHSA